MSKTQTIFYYHGDGLCIPGLPHAVTRVQAEALGLRDTLEAAIRSGVYQSQEPPPASTAPSFLRAGLSAGVSAEGAGTSRAETAGK